MPFHLHWHRHGDTQEAPDPIEIPEGATHVSIEQVPEAPEPTPEPAPTPEPVPTPEPTP